MSVTRLPTKKSSYCMSLNYAGEEACGKGVLLTFDYGSCLRLGGLGNLPPPKPYNKTDKKQNAESPEAHIFLLDTRHAGHGAILEQLFTVRTPTAVEIHRRNDIQHANNHENRRIGRDDHANVTPQKSGEAQI